MSQRAVVYIVVLDELMTGVSKLRKAYSLQIGVRHT